MGGVIGRPMGGVVGRPMGGVIRLLMGGVVGRLMGGVTGFFKGRVLHEGGLGADRVEVDEPGLEERPRHLFQRLVHAPV